jgi:hypothetical protein
VVRSSIFAACRAVWRTKDREPPRLLDLLFKSSPTKSPKYGERHSVRPEDPTPIDLHLNSDIYKHFWLATSFWALRISPITKSRFVPFPRSGEENFNKNGWRHCKFLQLIFGSSGGWIENISAKCQRSVSVSDKRISPRIELDSRINDKL